MTTAPDQRPGIALKQAEQAMVRAKSAALKLEQRMTDAGREALAAARRLAEPVERQVLGSFSADELEVLGALLSRWAQAFEAARPGRS